MILIAKRNSIYYCHQFLLLKKIKIHPSNTVEVLNNIKYFCYQTLMPLLFYLKDSVCNKFHYEIKFYLKDSAYGKEWITHETEKNK